MNKNGPIVIIEDDQDDQDLFSEALAELNFPNKIIYFNDGDKALDYLVSSPDIRPFLILSDINMPRLSGFALRDKVHNNEQLRLKCIPYLFFTTAASQGAVVEAYSKSVQGFFVKPDTFTDLKRVLHNIILYWQDCRSPNKID